METDPLLGDKLVMLRAVQWIMGLRDDPYALLLRTASDDPHELGRRIRDRGELYRSHTGAWVTARHATAWEIVRDERLRPTPPAAPDQAIPTLRGVLPLDTMAGEPVLGDKPPFDETPAAEEEEPVFDEEIVVTELADLSGEFDLAVLARRLSVRVASVPDRKRFVEAYAGAAGFLDAGVCPPKTDTARELLRSVEALGPLTAAAVGVELTANLICNAVMVLLDRPGLWAAVAAEPVLAHGAIQETLRWAPPVRLRALFATEDLALAGQRVQAGEEVVVAVEAAERDPEAHPDPDRFDIRRGRAARLVPPGLVAVRAATAAIIAFAAGLPRLRRAGPVVRRLRSPVTSGVLSLPVRSS